jgi:hypothetical protein
MRTRWTPRGSRAENPVLLQDPEIDRIPFDMPGRSSLYAPKIRPFGTFTDAMTGVSIPSHEGLAVGGAAPMSAA